VLLCAIGGVVLSSCVESDVDPSTDTETGSTHALLSIERLELESTEEASSVRTSSALAGFAQLPAAIDSNAVLTLVGWNLELPRLGECKTNDREPNATPLAPIDKIEFLEAGKVDVETHGEKIQLALRAFPTVTDLISGVVYTTRERTADLPASSQYVFRASGDGALQPLVVSARAPEALSGVTIGGVPLKQVREVSRTEPVDLTWNVGNADDVVYIELSSVDGLQSTLCAFSDTDGSGSVPEELDWYTGQGRLALHRVKAITLDGPGVENGELRFDFAVGADVVFAGATSPIPD
jgi:hypothetical protein